MKFLKIKNSTGGKQELFFYGDIVSSEWGKWEDSDTCPKDVRDILDQIDENKPLDIYINSAGGEVFSGLAIYNMLKRSKSYKTVHVDGMAASIASVIAMAGDKVIIPSNAFLMIHKPWTGLWGNSNDFRKAADDLDRIEEGILNVYKEKLNVGIDIGTIKQMLNEETWLNGQEASKYFNIEVVEANKAAACVSDYFKNYAKVPNELNQATIGIDLGNSEDSTSIAIVENKEYQERINRITWSLK